MLLLGWSEPLLTGPAGSEFGAAMVSGADYDGDGVTDLAIAAPGDGAVYVWLGSGAGLAGAADVTISGVTGSDFGRALAAVPDLDGDGLAELAIGAPEAGASDGAVTVIYSSTTGFGSSSLSLSGTSAAGRFGATLAAGDFDDDGWGDLAVGAPDAAGGGTLRGELTLWYGANALVSASLTLTGTDDDDALATSLAVADFDADGVDDLAASAPYVGSGTGEGRVSAWYGDAAGLASSADTIVTPTAGAWGSTEALAAGDFDGDGYADLAVAGGNNSTLVLQSDATGITATATTLFSWSSVGLDTRAMFASGDADGDGYVDLLVSRWDDWAPECTCPYSAYTALYLGSSAGLALLSTTPVDEPTAVALLRDIDGDGLAELGVASANDTLSVRPLLTDADGDGWGAGSGFDRDCDDADASISPIAPDLADDGVDQDCSGADTTNSASDVCERFTDWAAVESWLRGARAAPWPSDYVAEVEDAVDASACVGTPEAVAEDCVSGSVDNYECTLATEGIVLDRRVVSMSEQDWYLDGSGTCVYDSAATTDDRFDVSLASPTALGVSSAHLRRVEIEDHYGNRATLAGDLTFADGTTSAFTERDELGLEWDVYDTVIAWDDEWSWTLGSCTYEETNYVGDGEWVQRTASDGTHAVILTIGDVCGLIVPRDPVWFDDALGFWDGTTLTTGPDADADGYPASAADCDDTDATIHACAEDVGPDMIDQDCDGVFANEPDTDGDGVIDGLDCAPLDPTAALERDTWEDNDGDHYGDPASASILECLVAAGRSATDDDCDDTDATVNPGEPELCDSVDRDCSGASQDGAIDKSDQYTDADGDAWGTGSPTSQCAGAGFAAIDGDCDDTDAATYPGAPEVTGDGIDQDCDGADDRGAAPPPTKHPATEDVLCSTGHAAGMGWPFAAAMVAVCLRRGRR